MAHRFRLIMGRNCIAEVLKSTPARLIDVYTSQKPHGDELYDALIQHGVRLHKRSKEELSKMVNSDSHQSYVASVTERGMPTLQDFFSLSQDKERSVVLMLDSIYDPQNMGAILRAAECFGVDLVIYSKNRGADITPVVTKTSAGATELVTIIKVSNLVETAKLFQKEGFGVVCAEAIEGSESLYNFNFPDKTVLVLGSEGTGIQQLLSKKSDFHVSIPMHGAIDSLNVSQAAAVFLSASMQSAAKETSLRS